MSAQECRTARRELADTIHLVGRPRVGGDIFYFDHAHVMCRENKRAETGVKKIISEHESDIRVGYRPLSEDLD